MGSDFKTNINKSGIGNPPPNVNAVPDMTPLDLDPRYETVLLLVRHGESLGNAVRRFLGHTDLDLSERGYRQAERTAEFLAGERIDSIYSSDLLRAMSTAIPNAKRRSVDVIPNVRLREMFVGDWEGLFVEDIKRIYGSYFTTEWSEQFFSFRGAPGGESTQALAARINEALLDIARNNIGKTVLVAFHAAAIRAFWGRLVEEKGGDHSDIGFPLNASVSVLYFDGNAFYPGEYSHADHLRDL